MPPGNTSQECFLDLVLDNIENHRRTTAYHTKPFESFTLALLDALY